MRIAMFTETYLPHANGVTTSIANARAALTRRGHQVTIFSAGKRRHSSDGVHYYGGKSLTSYPDFPLAIYPALRQPSSGRVLRETGIQVAHLHGPGPMGLRGYRSARKAGIPYVYTYHTLLEPLTPYAPRGFRTILRRIATGLQGRLAQRASRFIVPSRYLLRAVSRGQPELARRCTVVPTGVDLERFRPDIDGQGIRRGWGFDEDSDVLLYLGRMGFEKRIHFLLDAFADLQSRRKNARLVLAGTGPAIEVFRRRARSLGVLDDVRFTGYVPDQLVPQTYAAADAFVSASDFETQGLTLLEAMATGKASAVAAAGGYLDAIRDGKNAYAFRPTDRHAAVDAMEMALDAPASVRRQARRTAEAFSLDHCTALLEKTYQDVLSPHAR